MAQVNLRPPGGEALVDAVHGLGCHLFEESVRQHLRAGAETPGDGLVLGFPVLLENGRDRDGAHRPGLVLELFQRVVHQHVRDLPGQHRDDLHNAVVPGLDGLFQPLQEGDEGRCLRGAPVAADGVAVGGGVGLAAEAAADQPRAVRLGPDGMLVEGAGAVGDGRRGPRAGEHVRQGRAFRIGIAGFLAAQDADAHAIVDVPAGGVDDAVPEREVAVGRVLEVEVTVVAAVPEGFGDERV